MSNAKPAWPITGWLTPKGVSTWTPKRVGSESPEAAKLLEGHARLARKGPAGRLVTRPSAAQKGAERATGTREGKAGQIIQAPKLDPKWQAHLVKYEGKLLSG